jgi:Ferredoxin-like domain in Api92-like protein
LPNWCECELTVTGPSADVSQFVDRMRTTAADGQERLELLQTYVPCPQPLLDVTSGSESIGYEILYTDQWETIAHYRWMQNALGGVPPTRELTWQAYVAMRYAADPTVLESELRALADRYKRNVEEYGYLDWYGWTNAEWGTKWGDKDTRIARRRARAVLLAFECAWAPPVEGLTKVAHQWRTLTFDLRYWEGGMGFKGRQMWRKGEPGVSSNGPYRGPRGG